MLQLRDWSQDLKLRQASEWVAVVFIGCLKAICIIKYYEMHPTKMLMWGKSIKFNYKFGCLCSFGIIQFWPLPQNKDSLGMRAISKLTEAYSKKISMKCFFLTTSQKNKGQLYSAMPHVAVVDEDDIDRIQWLQANEILITK